ncbi:MAG TPA: Ig-like domain-containing protein [Anaerolineaceae bacterium]
MNRIPIIIVRGLVVAAMLLAGSNIPAQTAPISTAVCGLLPGNATWSLSSSPYDVCGAGYTIPAGLTLTIDPGVTVQFDAITGNKLNVQGALVANGTATQEIILTGVVASPGSWGGISAFGSASVPAHVNLTYVTLDYGGGSGSYGAEVYADQAVVSITHSLIRNSAGNGVYISLYAQFDAHATNFVNNAQNAIQLNQPSTDLLMTELLASGNGANGVVLVGGSVWHGQKRWVYPGIPYIVDAPERTDLGDVLTIDPGNTLQFTTNGWLYVRGRLNAVGTASEPIIMTSPTKKPGAWGGIYIDGGQHQAVAQLDYVTIEYAGKGISTPNIEVANGRLIVAHSIIRYSLHDGVDFDSNWGGSILESQIVDNALYGVRNLTPARAVLATNNWWGDAGGPQSDVAGCSTGFGAKVTEGVFFLPVLIGPNATVPFPLSSAPILTLTPRRWFAPADGITRMYFDITVRDGNGMPLPGRKVRLTTSFGAVTDGGITDPNGKALAFMTSTSAGDAVVNASLDVVACEGALSPETTVTFTTPINVTELLPNAPSSYFDGDIEINPMPVITGVPTTITAKLTNPLTTPITVDVTFSYAQAGIGLVFGPIKDITGQVIPGNSSVSLSASFPTVVSGHYCVQVNYNITAIGLAPVLQPQSGSSGKKQKNLNAYPGSLGTPSGKEVLARADKSFKAVSKIPAGQTQVQKAVIGGWWSWIKGMMGDITTAEGLDPPRLDYNQVTLPVRHPIPLVLPDANISVPRAAALNAVNDALVEVVAFGNAATTAMDRYGGATAANNLQWSSEQANELLYYNTMLGTALLSYADRLDAFVLLLNSEGETQITVSVGDVTSYQQRLASSGFSAQEIADAKLIGLTDAQIETYRQAIIAGNPNDIAGNLLDIYTNEASISRALGNSMLYPPTFHPGFSVSGGAGLSPNATGNTMAQIYNSVSTIQLANPLAVPALIDVSARRIDLPADWTVYVSPVQVTLAPGEQTTVTVTIITGSPVPQGITPRVAVEGYAGTTLLGGVVIDTMVPNYTAFDGKLHVFLPLLNK